MSLDYLKELSGDHSIGYRQFFTDKLGQNVLAFYPIKKRGDVPENLMPQRSSFP
jgi:hypothetical protein